MNAIQWVAFQDELEKIALEQLPDAPSGAGTVTMLTEADKKRKAMFPALKPAVDPFKAIVGGGNKPKPDAFTRIVEGGSPGSRQRAATFGRITGRLSDVNIGSGTTGVAKADPIKTLPPPVKTNKTTYGAGSTSTKIVSSDAVSKIKPLAG